MHEAFTRKLLGFGAAVRPFLRPSSICLPLCAFAALREISQHRMKTSLLVLGVLNLLILGVRAQIPNAWTRNELAKVFANHLFPGNNFLL